MKRRTFVKGLAASSLLALGTTQVQAKTKTPKISNADTLSGNEFHLTIDYTHVNLTGEDAIATTVNGQLSGPTLVWQEGEEPIKVCDGREIAIAMMMEED